MNQTISYNMYFCFSYITGNYRSSFETSFVVSWEKNEFIHKSQEGFLPVVIVPKNSLLVFQNWF